MPNISVEPGSQKLIRHSQNEGVLPHNKCQSGDDYASLWRGGEFFYYFYLFIQGSIFKDTIYKIKELCSYIWPC